MLALCQHIISLFMIIDHCHPKDVEYDKDKEDE